MKWPTSKQILVNVIHHLEALIESWGRLVCLLMNYRERARDQLRDEQILPYNFSANEQNSDDESVLFISI